MKILKTLSILIMSIIISSNMYSCFCSTDVVKRLILVGNRNSGKEQLFRRVTGLNFNEDINKKGRIKYRTILTMGSTHYSVFKFSNDDFMRNMFGHNLRPVLYINSLAICWDPNNTSYSLDNAVAQFTNEIRQYSSDVDNDISRVMVVITKIDEEGFKTREREIRENVSRTVNAHNISEERVFYVSAFDGTGIESLKKKFVLIG